MDTPSVTQEPPFLEFPLLALIDMLVETIDHTPINEVLGDTKLPTIDEVLGNISLVDEVLGDTKVPRFMTEFTNVSHPQ